MPVSAYETLSNGICPWLQVPLERLEAAHRDGHLGHGWLLAGPQGVGKINLALTAARRLLERTDGTVRLLGAEEAAAAMVERHEPADRHPDLHWLFPEPKRRTLTVEQIREATRVLSLTSLKAQAKVLVLEPADAMTGGCVECVAQDPGRTQRRYVLAVGIAPAGKAPGDDSQSLPVSGRALPARCRIGRMAAGFRKASRDGGLDGPAGCRSGASVSSNWLSKK